MDKNAEISQKTRFFAFFIAFLVQKSLFYVQKWRNKKCSLGVLYPVINRVNVFYINILEGLEMDFYRIALGFAVCGTMVACGTKPAVETAPAPQSAPAPAVVDSSANATAAIPAEAAAAQSAPTEQKVSLDDPVARYSYALGMDLGKAVANVNVPLNMEVLMGAIQDQIDSARPVAMSDSACEGALQELLLKMQLQKDADARAAAKKALEDQAQFLAKNITDSTVKVTTKGVQYKVITEGTGLTPKASDKVKVHYVGTLLDGTEFDNSVKRGEPLEFPVSAVIEGWQDLLQVMKEGEKVKAWIPSALAYGEEGVEPLIPANSMLVFEVELLKVLAEVPAAEDLAAQPAAEAPKAEPAAESAKPAKK